MTAELVTVAKQLIKGGFTPIPLTGKRPVLDDWQKLHHLAPETVEQWERDGLLKNIGVVCGEASGNLVIIDFDGMAGYQAFVQRFPGACDTLTVKTGSGNGMHVYYRVEKLPEAERFMNIPDIGNIEFRSTGLQCVVPPSIHPDTHQPYQVAIRKPVKHIESLGDEISWARELKDPPPVEWKPPVIRVEKLDNINPRVLNELEGYFLRQPHAKRHGEWINAPCPNTSAHKHGDRNPSFGYNTKNGLGHCFACKTMLTGKLCELTGIDADSLGGLFEKREIRANGHSAVPPPEVEPPTLIVIERENILSPYFDRVLDAPGAPLLSSVIFPLRVLHKFGGTAVISRPGRLVGIWGTSGGGKTSLLETIVDASLQLGDGVLVWSPEWTADEFVERAIMRYGGPSVADLYKHDLYRAEREAGKTNPNGRLLTQDQEGKTSEILRMIRSWQGKVAYLEEPLLTIDHLKAGLPDVLNRLSFRPKLFIVDYAQVLYAMSTRNDFSMYDMLMQIKQICRANNLLGVVASQVTKAASKDRENGSLLSSQDGRFVNDDAFNLVITVNPEWRREIKTGPNGGDVVNVCDTAVLNITKNSLGQKGKVRVGVDLSRLSFEDREHSNQHFEED